MLLIGIDIYAFAISAHHASVRNITCRLNECLIQCSGILHEVVSSIMVMLVSVIKKKWWFNTNKYLFLDHVIVQCTCFFLVGCRIPSCRV